MDRAGLRAVGAYAYEQRRFVEGELGEQPIGLNLADPLDLVRRLLPDLPVRSEAGTYADICRRFEIELPLALAVFCPYRYTTKPSELKYTTVAGRIQRILAGQVIEEV